MRFYPLESDAVFNESLSWYEAESFCSQYQTMLRSDKTLPSYIYDTWIGMSRGYAYIYSESKYTVVIDKTASLEVV